MGFLVRGCLACLSQPLCSPWPQLLCLGGMGTVFLLRAVVFQASPILCFTSEKLTGSVFAGAGTHLALFPSRLAPLLPVGDKPAGHEALQAHGGHNQLIFRGICCFPPSRWGAKLLPPNPNIRLAEKLLSGAVGTELPPLQSTSLPAAVFAFSLVLR